jgi:hypothetical protein
MVLFQPSSGSYMTGRLGGQEDGGSGGGEEEGCCRESLHIANRSCPAGVRSVLCLSTIIRSM